MKVSFIYGNQYECPVFTQLLTVFQEMVVKFEKLSGVTVLKTWDSRVTHVVASVDENGACRRTIKYLMGILEGKWILNIECKHIHELSEVLSIDYA